VGTAFGRGVSGVLATVLVVLIADKISQSLALNAVPILYEFVGTLFLVRFTELRRP
jgi:hypothetical protein